MTDFCIYCNGLLSWDKVSECQVCRKCHPIQPPPKPELSYSLMGLEYCNTERERMERIEECARKKGWNPEKHIADETMRRFGVAV